MIPGSPGMGGMTSLSVPSLSPGGPGQPPFVMGPGGPQPQLPPPSPGQPGQGFFVVPGQGMTGPVPGSPQPGHRQLLVPGIGPAGQARSPSSPSPASLTIPIPGQPIQLPSPSPAASPHGLRIPVPCTPAGPVTPSSPCLSPPDDEETALMRAMCERIDADCSGSISRLELIDAVRRDAAIASFVLPGVNTKKLLNDEDSFEAVNDVFDEIAGGKQKFRYADFFAHFKQGPAGRASRRRPSRNTEGELRNIYNLIDTDRSGHISKLEFVGAVTRHERVAQLVLPGVHSSQAMGLMSDEKTYDEVYRIFEAIAGDKKRIDFADFLKYFWAPGAVAPRFPLASNDRGSTRVFVIGPGFGQQMNPQQGAMIAQAGYQVHWCNGIPNPEIPNFPVQPYLDHIRAEMEQFQPHVLASASKGGVYTVGLWQMGYWRGPTLFINAHPTCKQLPEGASVVLAQGSRDEVYPTHRAELERIVATGTENQCMLYYVANSGELQPGVRTRMGDMHNMSSLLTYDCLPRLIDATLCPEGPEMHLARTWRERLSDERLEAEEWLGYSPDQLRRRWASPGRKGLDEQKLWEVPRGSEEFQRVATVFRSAPREPPAYLICPQANWDTVGIKHVFRIENGLQQDGSARPYYDALRSSLEDQDVEFEPGVHTVWGFHGADAQAIDSIVNNPMNGIQPLASGSRNSTLWGSGTYFARDPKYVADGGFCGQPDVNGTRSMLMCLLMTGMPCLGDPQHKGVLPYRKRPHRYHSTVDCLSSPEIYIVQNPGAAHPAYLITFG